MSDSSSASPFSFLFDGRPSLLLRPFPVLFVYSLFAGVSPVFMVDPASVGGLKVFGLLRFEFLGLDETLVDRIGFLLFGFAVYFCSPVFLNSLVGFLLCVFRFGLVKVVVAALVAVFALVVGGVCNRMFFFGVWFVHVRVQRLGGCSLLASLLWFGFVNPKGFGSVNPKGYGYFLNLAVFGGLAALSLCFIQVC
jgi:hypothetical protein